MKKNQTIAMLIFIGYFFMLIMLSFGPLKEMTIGDNYVNLSSSLGLIDYTSTAEPGASILERINSSYTTSVNYFAFGSYLLLGFAFCLVIFFSGHKSG